MSTVTPAGLSDRLLAFQQRLERLRAVLGERGLDALVVTNPENRRYLTGFTGHDSGADSAGALVITHETIALITDGRYTEQAAAESPNVRIVLREGEFAAVAARTIGETGARRVGFEATHVTVAQRDDLAAALDKLHADSGGMLPELVPTRRLVEPLRAIKDAQELEALERAVAITDETFQYLCGYLRPGLTERQIAQEIERYMLERGADGLAFESIVASGPNGALPHAVPTDRPIALGEPITIDMGARYAGYCADMTRTICLGVPGQQAQEVYEAVLRAQEACERELRAGLTGREADALARDALTAAGYGDRFVHSTGHGVGLEIHEDPRLSRFATEETLQPGMAITIEPGVYVPGWGGVRIEDLAVVTDDGIRVLTRSHKHFALPQP
jgi:Xaa-Pro aminopeptidase